MINFLELTKSELRQKLLAYFFANPESSLYLRELAIILKEDPSNLSKELVKLEKEGLFIANERGNQKHFMLNKRYPLYNELKSIISKTVGMEKILKERLEKISGIQFAFIYGSLAKNKHNALSDIDLAIIGKINEDKLMEGIATIEKFFNREINYILYSQNDWKSTKKMSDTFTSNIYKEPKIMLIGKEDEL